MKSLAKSYLGLTETFFKYNPFVQPTSTYVPECDMYKMNLTIEILQVTFTSKISIPSWPNYSTGSCSAKRE